MKKTTSPYIKVKNSKIHSKGVFAKKDIKKGTKIIEYVGNKITSKEADDVYSKSYKENKKNPEKGSVYLFELNKKYLIDGDVPWNTAKYINHSCEPNCETEVTKEGIWIITLRKIKKGEELSYDYGYDFDVAEDHPCKCGKAKCREYIVAEEQWPKLKKLLAKKKK